MPTHVPFHPPSIPPGEHVCFPAVAPERRTATIVAFLAEGLARGERCSFVAPETERQAVTQALSAAGIEVDAARARGALALLDMDELYRPHGIFRADQTLAAIRAAVHEALARGFRGFRAAGYPTFRGEPLAEVLRYEAGLNDLVSANPQVSLLCCFDRRATPPALLRSLIGAHPRALLGDRLCRNHFYDPQLGRPMSARRASADSAVDWMINQLIRSQDAELELREDHDAMLRESPNGARHADRDGRHTPGLELRDRVITTVARQLAGPIASARAALDRDFDVVGRRDDARTALARIERLAERLDDVAAFLGSQTSTGLATERPADFLEIARDAVEAFKAGHPLASITLDGRGADPMYGPWDGPGVRRAIGVMLEVAHDHGWGTPISVEAYPVGHCVRLSVRYQALDTEPGGGRGAQERLSLDLFIARELVRRMEGTMGVAMWPDESVVLTAEMPMATGMPARRAPIAAVP